MVYSIRIGSGSIIASLLFLPLVVIVIIFLPVLIAVILSIAVVIGLVTLAVVKLKGVTARKETRSKRKVIDAEFKIK